MRLFCLVTLSFDLEDMSNIGNLNFGGVEKGAPLPGVEIWVIQMQKRSSSFE